MGLFSSVDNSKDANDKYIEKQLKNPDSWFKNSGEEDGMLDNPLSRLIGLGNMTSWPMEGLPRGMNRFGMNLGPLNVDLSLDPESRSAVKGDQIKEEGVTGLYNYKTPTDTQFAQCMDSQGLSVWDANGWWRCLFPQSIVSRNLPNLQDIESSMILTKEKVESDADHKLGLYFTDYTKYLLWKTQMNKAVEQRRKDEAEKQQRESALAPQTTTPEDMMLRSSDTPLSQNKDKLVVGSSEVLRSSMNSDGATEETRERKTYYDDGSVTLRTQKTTTPTNGGTPQVETHERVLRQPRDERSLFPFWRRK